MLVVVVALAISFGGSLRIYLSQQHDLAVAEQDIRERTCRPSSPAGTTPTTSRRRPGSGSAG
jgi:hypothetical protein